MESELRLLLISLSHYFSQHKVASREEIELAIKAETGRLIEGKREMLGKWLEGDLERVLFDSIVSEPISICSPDMTAKRNYLGEIFYHSRSHLYPVEEIEQAFRRLVEIRAPSTLVKLEKIVSGFVEKSGFKLTSSESNEKPVRHKLMTATKNGMNLLLFLLPSIVFIPGYSEFAAQDTEVVMVAPSERTPAPFIHFSRNSLKNLEDKGIQVWVVDLKAEVVNPFLGYPKDDDITKNFENPQQALMVARILSEHKISRLTCEKEGD